MRKIGIICNLMTNYGGVQTCVISLIKGLNQEGITPVLLSDNKPKKSLWEEQDLQCDTKNIEYSISVDTYKKYTRYLQGVWEFVNFFKTSWLKEKYDYIYIFQPNIMVDNDQKHLFYLSMSPRAYNFSKRKFLSNVKTNFYNIFLKKIHPIFEFQNYNCVINSEYTAKMFYDYYGEKIDVIYPSNSVEQFIPKEIKKIKNTVLYLSRIAEGKKPDLLIDLAKEHKDLTFFILGSINPNDSYFKLLKSKINKFDLKNIDILINLSYKELIQYLINSEYYVFFAENEHFGITTVEAILFDCIPFVHNSGGQKEIVSDTHLRFDYYNLEEKFNELLKFNKNKKIDIKNKLKIDVMNFKEKVFINKMIAYLQDMDE